MASPLPPDPYGALGVAKDATSAQIKTTYRKLALKCHPDKVTDDSLKASAADQFHRIQQAYEILGDEDKKNRYDAQIKLAELRKEAMQRQGASGPRVDVRTAAFEVPVSTPGRAAFTTRGPDRVYEERKPSKAYDSDYDYFGDTRTSSRKYDEYEKMPKRSSPREEKERFRAYDRDNKENEKVNRSDKRRTREKETKRDRETKKHVSADDGSDATEDTPVRQKYENTRRREDERERERYMAAQAKRHRETPVQQEPYEDRTRKYSDKESEARMYMEKARDGGISSSSSARPSVPRTTSLRDTYVDKQRDRPAFVRRSSARPTSKRDPSPPTSSRRDRDRERERTMSIPEIDDYEETRERRDSRERRPPALSTARSSPAAIKIPRERAAPSRSQSMQADFDHRDPPPPSMRRSETMPLNGHTSPRRKEEYAPQKHSGLRKTEINDDTGMPTPSATPESYAAPGYTSVKYRYPTAAADDDDVEYTNGRRTVLREPNDRERDRRNTRSPSPGARQTRSTSARYPAPAPPPPPLRTTQPYDSYGGPTMTESPTSYNRPQLPRRETSDRLYGEIPSAKPATNKYDYPSTGRGDREERTRDSSRDNIRRRRSPDNESVQFSKKITPEDVRFQTGYATSARRSNAAHKPQLSRGASYVY